MDFGNRVLIAWVRWSDLHSDILAVQSLSEVLIAAACRRCAEGAPSSQKGIDKLQPMPGWVALAAGWPPPDDGR
jgi:hypothetical protein